MRSVKQQSHYLQHVNLLNGRTQHIRDVNKRHGIIHAGGKFGLKHQRDLR